MGTLTKSVPLPPPDVFARVKAGVQAKFPKEAAGVKWDDANLSGKIEDSRASVEFAVKADGSGSRVDVEISGPFAMFAEAMLRPKISSFLDGLAQ